MLVGVGYQTLQSLLLDFCKWLPSRKLLDALLGMLVDGTFEINEKTTIKVCNLYDRSKISQLNGDRSSSFEETKKFIEIYVKPNKDFSVTMLDFTQFCCQLSNQITSFTK